MSDGDPSVPDHYDALADRWNEFTEVPWKAALLWPTVRSLLPPVSGKRVLDAGCGDGTYAAWLAERGADVLGVDLSEAMIDVAREQYGERAEFRRADLGDSLAFAEDGAFDLVLCQHVWSHLSTLDSTVDEFARVLRPAGSLVVSTHHPFHDFLVVREQEYPDTQSIDGMDLDPVVEPASADPSYHETERFEIHWGGSDTEHPGTYHRRSLSDLLTPLLDAGFELRELVEPDLRDVAGEGVPDLPPELLRRPPRSICLRAER